MRRLSALLATMLLGATGCLSPLTTRLDRVSQQLEGLNEQLLITNQKLDESNVRLKKMAGDE